MRAKQFTKGQIYQGKTIKHVFRVLDHYLLKMNCGAEVIVKIKDL